MDMPPYTGPGHTAYIPLNAFIYVEGAGKIIN
jgi:hypothetical protein